MPKKKPAESESPRFEEAMAQLQAIAHELEDGQLGLEQALQQYEQGTALLRHCYRVLADAEQKIEQLTGFNDQGEAECEPFDASATLQQREQTAGRRSTGTTTTPTEIPPASGSSKPKTTLFEKGQEPDR